MSKAEEASPLFVRVDKKLKKKIEDAAAASYMSVSAFVRSAVLEHMRREEKRNA